MSTFADRLQGAGGAASAAGRAARRDDGAPLESVSARTVCLMRFALALSALVIVYIDPSEPDRFVALTYAALILYTTYSGLLYLAAARGLAYASSPATTWVDVGSYAVFIALSSGTGSIFTFFFFFAILVVSFRGGFESGLRVTFVSTLLFACVGYAASAPQDFELNRFLLRPIYLLVLGYMIAVWGGSELSLKRRLAFLKGVSRAANPRFGVDQTLGTFMESVRRFYDADTCLLVERDAGSPDYSLRRADHYKADRAVRAERVTGEIGCQLLSLLGDEAVAVTLPARRRRGAQWQLVIAGDPETDAREPKWFCAVDGLKNLIGDGSFMSLPWRQRDGAKARLYVTSRARGFKRGDLDFLCQVVEHVTPVIENTRLLDRLASAAAEQERRRISRDLHDSTVQPYVGLKMGIESVRRKAAPDNPLAADLEELLLVADTGLSDLRRYVRALRQEEQGGVSVLSDAVRQYVEQFTRLSGIEVALELREEVAVSDRVAAEAFQIVREGLSNVRRHTRARRAAVRLSCAGGRLVIEVENEAPGQSFRAVPFIPRSIGERAATLGGETSVREGEAGVTLVRVEIPL